MSTQKRENRSQRFQGTERARAHGAPGDRFLSLGWNAMKFPLQVHLARYVRAAVNGPTASFWSIIWSAWAWFHPRDRDPSPGPRKLATEFLQSDHHPRQLVQPFFEADHRGSPPLRAARPKASPRLSRPHIPYPSGLVRLHPTLPQDPAGDHRRAERYDGKRDMYFQHAA